MKESWPFNIFLFISNIWWLSVATAVFCSKINVFVLQAKGCHRDLVFSSSVSATGGKKIKKRKEKEKKYAHINAHCYT